MAAKKRASEAWLKKVEQEKKERKKDAAVAKEAYKAVSKKGQAYKYGRGYSYRSTTNVRRNDTDDGKTYNIDRVDFKVQSTGGTGKGTTPKTANATYRKDRVKRGRDRTSFSVDRKLNVIKGTKSPKPVFAKTKNLRKKMG